MIPDIFTGLTAYFNVFENIRRYKLRRYLMIPVIIALLFGILTTGLVYGLSDNVGQWLISWYVWDWGAAVINKAANIIGGLILLIALSMLYRYVLLIVISPFLSLLSSRIEQQTTIEAKEAPFSMKRALYEIWRGIRITARNLAREIFLTILLLLLGLVPGVGWISPALIFVVQSYFAGFGNMDFTLERHLNLSDSVEFVKRNRGLALGNGIVFMGMLLVPIIGVTFAPVLGVIAVTKPTLKRLGLQLTD